MNEFNEAMKREQKRILRLADLTASAEDDDGSGFLVLEKRGDRTYCYKKASVDGQTYTKKYLGMTDSAAARQFVKARYLQEKRSRLITDQKLIEKMMREYQDYSYEAVMAALSASYKMIANEDFNNQRYEEIKAWANEDYPVNQAPFPKAKIYAWDGRRVRSKGECIHLNIYTEMGIPFRYDSLMTFEDQNGNRKTLSPDILIQCFNRKLVAIEHAGRLFDPRYAADFGDKLYWYLQGGFVLGKNFFVTSDDKYGGTDSQAIMQVALEVERLFYAD